MVKTESSTSDLFDLSQNKFFVQGDSGIKYSYNNANIATDPVLASQNFMNALEKMPTLIEKYQNDTEKISKDIPVLESVLGSTWKKEEELRELKTELQTLDRKIQLSLKPIEQGEAPQEEDGFRADTINKDSELRKSINDLYHGEYGADNPRSIEHYEKMVVAEIAPTQVEQQRGMKM